MFCGKCGSSVDEKSLYCSRCGAKVNGGSDKSPKVNNEEKEKLKDSQKHKEYIPKMKRIRVLSIMMESLVVLLVFGLVFAPMFQFTYEPQSLEEWEELTGKELTIEDFFTMLAEDSCEVTDSFSLFDDAKDAITKVTGLMAGSNETDEENVLFKYITLAFSLYSLLAVFMAVTVLCSSGIKWYNLLSEFDNADKAAFLMYSEIKKTGSLQEKVSGIFKKQSIISVIMLVIFDVFFSRIFKSFIPMMMDAGYEFGYIRYMLHMSGFTGYVWLMVAGLVFYAVVKATKTRETNELVYSINQENFS